LAEKQPVASDPLPVVQKLVPGYPKGPLIEPASRLELVKLTPQDHRHLLKNVLGIGPAKHQGPDVRIHLRLMPDPEPHERLVFGWVEARLLIYGLMIRSHLPSAEDKICTLLHLL
jgi:hypothetical protein